MGHLGGSNTVMWRFGKYMLMAWRLRADSFPRHHPF